MSHNRNLKYQYKNAIEYHFSEGMQKHSMKKNGQMQGDKIFSYADRKNLIDLSSNFANYMKIHYSDIRLVKDVTNNHIQEFLNSKIDECSKKTLQQYQSRFRKMEKLVSDTYKITVDYHSTITPLSTKNGGGKIRNFMFSDNEYNKLLSSTNENLRKALILSKEFGCRCSEISKLDYG